MIKLNPKNRLKWDVYFRHPFFSYLNENDL
jgi:hypothetical protein